MMRAPLGQQDAQRSQQCTAEGSAAGDDDAAGRRQEVGPGLVRLQHDEVPLAVLVDQLQPGALRQRWAVVLPQPRPQRPATPAQQLGRPLGSMQPSLHSSAGWQPGPITTDSMQACLVARRSAGRSAA